MIDDFFIPWNLDILGSLIWNELFEGIEKKSTEKDAFIIRHPHR